MHNVGSTTVRQRVANSAIVALFVPRSHSNTGFVWQNHGCPSIARCGNCLLLRLLLSCRVVLAPRRYDGVFPSPIPRCCVHSLRSRRAKMVLRPSPSSTCSQRTRICLRMNSVEMSIKHVLQRVLALQMEKVLGYPHKHSIVFSSGWRM